MSFAFVCENQDDHDETSMTEVVMKRPRGGTWQIAGYRCLVCGFTDVDGEPKHVDPDFVDAYLDPDYAV